MEQYNFKLAVLGVCGCWQYSATGLLNKFRMTVWAWMDIYVQDWLS